MERKSANEEHKKKQRAASGYQNSKLPQDHIGRVKVLSPGRLVINRFLKNKLAIAGTAILILMFLFSFLGPVFYPYGQTEKFYKYDHLNIRYATASERNEFVPIELDSSAEIPYTVKNMMNSYISSMAAANEDSKIVTDQNENSYRILKNTDHVYLLQQAVFHPIARYSDSQSIGTYHSVSGILSYVEGIEDLGDEFTSLVDTALKSSTTSFIFDGISYKLTIQNKVSCVVTQITDGTLIYETESLGADFEIAVKEHLPAGQFSYGGKEYVVSTAESGSTVLENDGFRNAYVYSDYVFDAYEPGANFDYEFQAGALLALNSESGTFSAGGANYMIRQEKDAIKILDAAGKDVASLSTLVIRRYNGEDTLSLDFKAAVTDAVLGMKQNEAQSSSFSYLLPQMDLDGNYTYDESGNPVYEDTIIHIENKNDQFVLTCEQITHLIDIYASPSSAHVFGTDGDGYDILARMMYGGRISLMVGFVVVLLETILGVILGEVAGFFGGWIDTLVMRLVDIFNCIPSLPILIILGAYFDSLKMNAYIRLVWMMAVLGILGWSGVARLVRGQILSLREQEFMIAAEACGISTGRRIYRHLLPNVMPQLIVTATAGLGSVIITESTLSFLGLGVKHPLATWGTMINSVTASSESMIKYTYIWIPVGLLICLTVIAFNFVGDGLRDAFDPKMKR